MSISSSNIAVDRAQFNTLSSIQDQIIIIENNLVEVTNVVNNMETTIVTDVINTTNVITDTITTTGDLTVNTDKFTVDATTGNTTIGGDLSTVGVIVCEDIQTTGTHPITSLNDTINTLTAAGGSLVGLQNQIDDLSDQVDDNTAAITALGTSITTGSIHSSTITNTGSLAAGSTIVSSLTSSGAISGTSGTFSGAVASSGLSSSAGLIVSSGSTVLGTTTAGALTASSGTFSGALVSAGLASSSGLSVNTGTSTVQALNAGSTSVTSLTDTGNATIGGNLSVSGTTTLSNTLKLPSFTTSQMNAIATPANGMLIYNSSTTSLYAYQGGAWAEVNPSSAEFSGSVTVGSLTASGGLTVSSGTTAVQTLSATSITNTGNETISGTLSAGATTVSSLSNSGNESITGNLTVNTNKFTVASSTGNTAIAGTLGVTGNTTLGGSLSSGSTTVTSLTNSGAEAIAGNLTINTNKFTVDASDGNTAIAGTLNVTGSSTLGTTSAGATSVSSLTNSGNESITGTLNVTGSSTLGTVSSSALSCTSLTDSGNATVGGTLGVTGISTLGTVNAGATSVSSLTNSGTSALSGNVAVATNKFTVNATSGNTVVAGTLNVAGTSTLSGVTAGSTTVTSLTNSGAEAISGNLTVNTNKFTVDSSTGNTAIAGTLDVTGSSTLGSTTVSSLIDSGNATITGNLIVGGNITANGSSIISNSVINEYNYMTITQNPADGTHAALSISQGGTASGPILEVTDSDSSVVFSINQNCDLNLNSGKFSVASSSGNTVVGGTLNVTGATTLGGVITLPNYTTGQMNSISSPTNGMMIYNTTDSAVYAYQGGSWAVVAGGSGGGSGTFTDPISAPGITSSAGLTVSSGSTDIQNITTTGIHNTGVTTLDGNVAVNTNKFTVAASTGNTIVAGTLGVTGATTLSSTLNAGATTVSSLTDSGNASITGTLNAGATTISSLTNSGSSSLTGDVSVNTNKFTVEASSGNTAIAGTLNAVGNTTIGGTLGVTGVSTLAGTTVTTLSASGNTTVGGTLGVTGASTLAGTSVTTLNASSNATIGGTFGVTGTTTLGTTTVTSLSDSGNATITGTLGVTGTTTVGTLNAGATTVSSLTDSGNASITGTLSAGATTVSSLTNSGNASITGTLGVVGTTTLGNLTSVGTANINTTGTAATNIGNTTGNTSVTGSLTASGNITSSSNVVGTAGSFGNIAATTALVSSTSEFGGNVKFQTATYNASSATSGSVIDTSGATSSVILPKGTTGQRPTGVTGMLRYNTTTDAFEGYSGSSASWGSLGSGGSGGSGISELASATYTGWNVGIQKKIALSTPLSSVGAHIINVMEQRDGSDQTDSTWLLSNNPTAYEFYSYRGSRGDATISGTNGFITITLGGSDVWTSADLYKAFTDGTGYATIVALVTTKIAQATVSTTFTSSGSKSSWYLYLGTINSAGNFSLVNALSTGDMIMNSSMMPNRSGINSIQHIYDITYPNSASGYQTNPSIQWGQVYYMDITYYSGDKILVGFIGGTFRDYSSTASASYISHNLIVSYDGGFSWIIPYPENTTIYPYGTYSNIQTGSGDTNYTHQSYYSQGPISVTYSAGYIHMCYMGFGHAYNYNTANDLNQTNGQVVYIRMTIGTAPTHSTRKTIASTRGQEAGSNVCNSTIGYPKICATNSGVLYVLFQDSVSGTTSTGRLLYSISTNNGTSWSQPAQVSTGLTSILANVFSGQYNQVYQQYYPTTYTYDSCSDSQLASSFTNNQYFVVVAKAPYNSAYYQIYFGYFSNGTSTYSVVSTPVSSSTEFNTANCSLPHIYCDKNAKLHVVFYATSSTQGTGMFYVYSTNTGTSWSSPALVTTDTLWYKCKFVEKPNSVLNLVYNNGGILSFYTLDNGSSSWYNKTGSAVVTLENYDIARMSNYPSLTPQFTSGDITCALYDNDYLAGAINLISSSYPTYPQASANGYYSYNYGFREDTTKRKWNITKRVNDYLFDNDYNTTMSANNQYRPKLIAYNNVLYLVWSGTTTALTTQKIYMSTSSNRGHTWSTPTRVSNLGTTYAELYPDMTIDSNGLVHVVFSGLSSYDATYHQIWYQNSSDATTWSSSYNISQATGYTQTFPTIITGGTNQIFVFWSGQGLVSSVTAYRIYWAYNSTVNAPNVGWVSSGSPIFGTTYSPYAQTIPRAAYYSGYLYLIWISNSTSSTTYKKLYFAYNNISSGITSTWTSDASKPAGDYSTSDVKIGALAVDLTGKVHVLYSAGSNGQYVYATYTSNNGTTWSTPNKRSSIKSENISVSYPFATGSTTISRTLSVHVDASGYVHFTFIGGNAFNTYDWQVTNIANETSTIYHSYTDDNGTTYKGMKALLPRTFGLNKSSATQADNQISVTSINSQLYVMSESVYSQIASTNSLYLHEYTDQDVKFGCLINASSTYNTSDLYDPISTGSSYTPIIRCASDNTLWITGFGTSTDNIVQTYAWKSTNGGLTWTRYLVNDSSSAAIAQSQTYRNINMFVDSSDAAHIVWCGNNSTFSNTSYPRLYYNKITSSGTSFGTTITVDTTTGSNLSYIIKGCDSTINSAGKIYASYARTLHLGLGSAVYCCVTDSLSNLYAGGTFSTAGGNSVAYVAKWNGTNWSALGSGLSAAPYCMCVDSANNLYVGGSFDKANGTSTQVNYVAKWNGTTWSSMNGGVGNIVFALCADSSNNIYAGGQFTNANTGGTATVNYVTKWNGSAWVAMNSGVGGVVYCLCVDSANNIYACGNFTTVNGSSTSAGYIGKWNGSTWSVMNNGLSAAPYSVCADLSNNIYVAGSFGSANGSSTAVNYVAKYNGTSWSALGTGLNSTADGITTDNSGNVYVSYAGTTASGISAPYVAKYNGSVWSSMGTGANTVSGNLITDRNTNTVYITSNSPVYSGGATIYGTMSYGYLASWNATSSYWITGGPGTISYTAYVATLDNGSSIWNAPVQVSLPYHYSYQTRVKCDSDDNIHVAYSAIDATNASPKITIYYTKLPSGSSTWSTPIVASSYAISLALDCGVYFDLQIYNGYVYIIYQLNSARLLMAYKTIAATSFSTVPVSTETQPGYTSVIDYYPEMHIINNKIHVTAAGTQYDIQYYRRYNGSGVFTIKYFVCDLNDSGYKFYHNSTVPFNSETFSIRATGSSQLYPSIIVDNSGIIHIAALCFTGGVAGYNFQRIYHARSLNANSVKTNTYATAISSASAGTIDIAGWDSVDAVNIDQDLNDQTAYYAVSISDESTYEDWYVFNTSGSYRRIVRYSISGGTFLVNTNSTFGSETWATPSNTNIYPVLEEALGYSQNIMTGATLNSVLSSSLATLTDGSAMRFAMMIKSSTSTLNPEISGATVQYTIPDYYLNTTSNYSIAILNVSLVGVTPTTGSSRTATVYVSG